MPGMDIDSEIGAVPGRPALLPGHREVILLFSRNQVVVGPVWAIPSGLVFEL
jgi:hypothetical protein